MRNYIETIEIGRLSYRIEKSGPRDYRLWQGGCCIGRPRADKPPTEVWEYHAKTLAEARKEIKIDAKERLEIAIRETETRLDALQPTLRSLVEGQ